MRIAYRNSRKRGMNDVIDIFQLETINPSGYSIQRSQALVKISMI